MARSDLLIKLVKSGASGNQSLFRKVVQSLIAEERNKQHHILAKRLEEIIYDQNFEISKNVLNVQQDQNGVQQFFFNFAPRIPLNSLYFNENIVQIVEELKEEHFRKDLLRSHNIEPRNRIILTGAPGTGKTSLAEAIASELMIPFLVVKYESIIGSYLGETANKLSKLLNFVSTQNCVLFFDEFDAIGKERGDIHETGEIKRVVNSLLLQLDQLPSHVVIITATNHPELLDKAVWRRFQIRIDIEKPDKKLIERFLQDFEKKYNLKLETVISKLATRLVGLTFSEIKQIFDDIRRKYILNLPGSNIKAITKKRLEMLPGL